MADQPRNAHAFTISTIPSISIVPTGPAGGVIAVAPEG
ncbi:hypothetical protein CLU85_1837 [Acidovorax sp. 69]|nr:hypothetical protein CLU85_1837 [Acidovorax sp. 69]